MLDIKTENALDIHCDDIVNHSLSPGKNKECGSGSFFEGQIRIRFFVKVGSESGSGFWTSGQHQPDHLHVLIYPDINISIKLILCRKKRIIRLKLGRIRIMCIIYIYILIISYLAILTIRNWFIY